MIEFKINNETYTEEQFRRDLEKYFKSLKENGENGIPCNIGLCWKCILNRNGWCNKFKCNSEPIGNSFEIVKAIHDWAKEHPVKTNRDKLKEVFGEGVLYMFLESNYRYGDDIKRFEFDTEFEKWLNAEYKGNKKDE